MNDEFTTLIAKLRYDDCDAECKQPCTLSQAVRDEAADMLQRQAALVSRLQEENFTLRVQKAASFRPLKLALGWYCYYVVKMWPQKRLLPSVRTNRFFGWLLSWAGYYAYDVHWMRPWQEQPK